MQQGHDQSVKMGHTFLRQVKHAPMRTMDDLPSARLRMSSAWRYSCSSAAYFLCCPRLIPMLL